jgi:hypothetical protein
MLRESPDPDRTGIFPEFPDEQTVRQLLDMIRALRVQWSLFRLPEFNDTFSMGFAPRGRPDTSTR